ncbi:MAG: hypothetical protein F4213_02870 [Boseongicola sp. SB0677_bin_26]|nr:hypothetical protein [Boseongicola sp. SB0665_bin_10]MYG24959.1 hypothetical protein [Boseongicola sp. SB0677_bin_26]
MADPRPHADFTESRFCHEERIACAIVARPKRIRRLRTIVRERYELVTGRAVPDGRRVFAIHLVTG